MAGIMANSVSATMVSGDTSADKTVSGYLTRERIVLSATGTNTSYLWALVKPESSGAVCDLDSTTDATPSFVPDVEGYYTATVTLDGTTAYVIRVAVASIASTSTISILRFLPLADSQVPDPATGGSMYWSSTSGGLVVRHTDGTTHLVSIA